MTSFRAAAANNSGSSIVSSINLTIPASVQPLDGLLLVTLSDSNNNVNRTHNVASTGNAWTEISTPARVGSQAYYYLTGTLWTLTAGSGDAGATLTISITGGGLPEFMGAGLIAYDVQGFAGWLDVYNYTPTNFAKTIPSPAVTPGQTTDWTVYLLAANFGTGGPGSLTAPSGTTSQEYNHGNDGQLVSIADLETASGSPIGGNSWANSTNLAALSWVVGINSNATMVTDTDTVSGTDAGESVHATLSSADSISNPAFDAGENIVQKGPYPTSDSGSFADAVLVHSTSSDTASAVDNGTVQQFTLVSVFSSDSTIKPTNSFPHDTDHGIFTDAGNPTFATLLDVEGVSGQDG
jgi:hypothetical protein